MKAKFNNIEIEGTPKEMAEFIQNILIRININDIPNCFGETFEDRLKTWQYFKKNYGINICE